MKENWNNAVLALGLNMKIRSVNIPDTPWRQVTEVERIPHVKVGDMVKKTNTGWHVYQTIDSPVPVFKFPSRVTLTADCQDCGSPDTGGSSLCDDCFDARGEEE